MNSLLIQFLSKFHELTPNQVEALAQIMTVVEVKRNSLIVKEGQFCDLCYFILKGCLRQYVIQDGIEKTIAIYTENQAVNYYAYQSASQQSESYLCSVENSTLLIGNPKKDEELYAKFPILTDITRRMIEDDFGKAQSTITKIITLTPEQRYINLLNERPDLFQRLPQHIIASYLGIAPESLSRIKKRLYQDRANKA